MLCCHLLVDKVIVKQSHVGHQQSAGTAEDELISCLVSTLIALSTSPSPSIHLSLLSLTKCVMMVVAMYYLQCCIQELSCWHEGNETEQQKGNKSLKFGAEGLSKTWSFGLPPLSIGHATVRGPFLEMLCKRCDPEVFFQAAEFILNKFVSECV